VVILYLTLLLLYASIQVVRYLLPKLIMTTSNSATFTSSLDLVDYWASPLVEPNYNQLSIFDVAPQVIPNKNSKHHACIDPLILMLFIATCFEQNLIEDSFLDNFDEKQLLNNFRKPGHPIYTKLQSLFGLSLHVSTTAYKSLIKHMHDSNVDFESSFYNEAFKLAKSMKHVYALKEIDKEQIKSTCSVVNKIRNDESLIYDELQYIELVKEIDYMFLTSDSAYTVTVTKEIEDNIHYISSIKPGVNHFNTYVTATIMPFVIGYVDKFGQIPSNVHDFSTYLQTRLIEQST
jgi:hypothetical protein